MFTNTKYHIIPAVLTMFTGNTNVTGDSGLTGEMKTFYSDYLIDLAEPLLVHDQFGQKHPIPKNGGKKIEFRKYAPLVTIDPKSNLTEGVTPNGQKLSMSTLEAEVKQYGGYVELSDILLLTAIDNNLVEATRLLADQAGRTLDTITRETLCKGTNVQYADGQVSSRGELTAKHKLTIDGVRKAVRFLKVMNARKINGYYAGIIHPDVSYDLMSDPKWVNVKTYSDPDGIYEGEIGRIEGVRFVETSEAKIFKHGSDGATLTDVYATLILGADAYGITELTGGGLQHIVKQLGSAGTADPLNQRATAGWKATRAVEILVQEYMIRIETGSSFGYSA